MFLLSQYTRSRITESWVVHVCSALVDDVKELQNFKVGMNF